VQGATDGRLLAIGNIKFGKLMTENPTRRGAMMMESKDITREMIRYMRTMYEMSMTSTQALCNYADKVFELTLLRSTAAQEENRRFFKDWIEHCKKARDDYFRVMNENFLQIQEYFKDENE
jgi:hypothetical protein